MLVCCREPASQILPRNPPMLPVAGDRPLSGRECHQHNCDCKTMNFAIPPTHQLFHCHQWEEILWDQIQIRCPLVALGAASSTPGSMLMEVIDLHSPSEIVKQI